MRLAERYATGDRVEAAPRRAAILLRIGCEADASACEAAERFLLDRRVPLDARGTFDLAVLVCRRFPRRCRALADAFDDDTDAPFAWSGGLVRVACDADRTTCGHEDARIALEREYPDDEYQRALATQRFDELAWRCPLEQSNRRYPPEAEVCVALAGRYRDGAGVEKDPARATTYLRLGCDAGSAEGCYQLAHLYRLGIGVRRQRDRAAELYARACTAHHAFACWRLGRQYASGIGVVRDRDRARELLSQSCTDGIEAACRDRDALPQRAP